MKLYLDSNVLISYLRSEIDRAFNLRFLDSENFLIACKALGIEVVISELFMAEVGKTVHLSYVDIKEVFENLGITAIPTGSAGKPEVHEIMRKTKLHFSDALHVANALREGCASIITWNIRDFEKARAMIPCATPRSFLQAL